MKKLIYLLFLVPFCVNAQIVNIPDANFKAKLLSMSTPIDTNNDGEIQVSEAAIPMQLDVSNANISDLTGIESFTNLYNLNCNNNQISAINTSNLIHLNILDCTNNQITALNIASLSNLMMLYCDNNQITSLEVPPLVVTLWCNNNQLTSLQFSENGNLHSLRCSNNLLTSLNVSGLPLYDLYCNNNQLNSINLENCSSLNMLFLDNNQLTTLDISTIHINSLAIAIHNNPLISLFLKNGYSESINYGLVPSLSYICADEQDLSYYEMLSPISMFPNIVINSYCSFIPGGNFNLITGTTTFDSDNNGCDVADLPKPNIKININDGTNQGATFSNNSGYYNFYTQAGNFTLTPNIENPSWFTFSPATATIPFADNNNNISEQNFCISSNGIHNDIEVVIAPLTPARPGFDATYQIVYKNKGNQTLSGNVSLTFNDDKTDFVSAIPNPDNLAVNLLSWNYTNLLPFESRTINVTLNVNAPTDTPPVNIGDELDFVVAINPIVNDEIPFDNVFGYKQTVVGSYDPNNIECLEGEVVAPSYIGQYLHYAVNFENTGNSPAENIVIKIVIDTTKYDMNSLQLLNVSHNSYTRIKDNIVEIIFQQINLDSGGHGNLLFKIRTNNNLVVGNSVAKRADIFFDYNAPIDTGMVNTTFEVLNNSVFELDDSISIYPNPTSSIININGNFNIKTIELYDAQGRLLVTKLLDEVQTSIDISEKSSGIYFLKITSDKGSKVEKLIKE